jgi:hypothetical protein
LNDTSLSHPISLFKKKITVSNNKSYMPKLNVNSRIDKYSLVGMVSVHDLKLDQSVLAGSDVVFNSLTTTDFLTVGGNMTVNGSLTVLSTETLEILDNIIEINKGETGAGVSLVIAGLEVNRGSLTNQQIIFQETTDTWRTGEIGSTQSLTNRENTPLINGIMTWNDTDKRIDSSNQIDIDIIFSGNNPTSKSSGGIRLTGGIGIEGDAYIGGTLYFEGTSPIHATITSNAANDFNINSSADINLTAIGDINIPANVGVTFGSDSLKIESNGTDLTVNSGGILILEGNTVDINSTGDITIDTTSRIDIATGVSGVPILIGHTVSETTIGDNLTIQGDVSITGLTNHQGVVTIDETSTEALLVRKDGDTGDVFSVDTTNSVVAVTGDITVSGTVDGIDIATQDSKLEMLYTTIGLSSLTTGEVDQLENIGATTISATQWGYLGAIDQGLTTTDSVQFNSAIVDSTSTEALLVRKDGDTGDVFTVDTTNSVVAVTGDITVTGTVDGIDIATQDSKLETLYTTIGLSALTSGEVEQLENIGATTISATQWGYLGATDQALATTDNVQFNSAIVDSTSTEALLVRKDGDTGDVFTVDTTNSVVAVTGDITVSGTVDGIDIATQDSKLETLYTTIGLSSLTTGEVDQLENIGATTISATQWGYLGATDQGLTTTDSVQFNSAIVDSTSTEALLVRKEGDSGDVFSVNTTDSVVLINGVNITPSNGEISEISFNASNNTSVAADLTGFLFAEGIVRSFKAIVSVSIIATANLYEQIEVRGLQMTTGTWIITESKIGDDTNIDLSIISSGGNGQIQYTSTNISGFVSSLIKIVSKEVTTI